MPRGGSVHSGGYGGAPSSQGGGGGGGYDGSDTSGDRSDANSGGLGGSGGGMNQAEITKLVESMMDSGFNSRYDQWEGILEEMQSEAATIAASDKAFREQVWEQQLSKEQDLYDLASKAGKEQVRQQGLLFDQGQDQYQSYLQNFAPQERAMAANAMGMQYLSPEDQQGMLTAMQDPGLSMAERAQMLQGYQSQAQGIARGEIDANAAQIESDLTARAQEIEQYYGKEAADLFQREATRAREDEARGRVTNQANINSAYGQQQREMGRRGFNPAQIAQAATANANQQALAQITGNNQLYGMTAARLGAADDAATNLRMQGALTGMDTRFQGQDTARTMRMGGAQAVRDQFSGMQNNAAAFGRNLPAYGLQSSEVGANVGSQGVGNQATGYGASLPYAQFAVGGTPYGLQATQMGQQGGLGMANIVSQDWRTKYATDNAQGDSGSSSGGLLGAIVGGALGGFSDPALKENEVPIATWNDLTVYEFNYIGDSARRIGFMATEVMEKVPQAVSRVAGYLHIDFHKLEAAYGL